MLHHRRVIVALAAIACAATLASAGAAAGAEADASHVMTGQIKIAGDGEADRINTFCLDAEGRILVSCGGTHYDYVRQGNRYVRVKREQPPKLRRLSAEGKVDQSVDLPFKAEAINVGPEGAIYIGGEGRVARLDQELKVTANVASPALADAEGRSTASSITGLACSDKDVFVCCRSPKGRGYAIYRLDQALANPVKIADGLSGCCGELDIQSHDGKVYAAENSRMRVVGFDRDGKRVAVWGQSARRAGAEEGFGSCCNPMNIRFGSDGLCYTSEASVGSIKQFTPDGKYQGLVCQAKNIPSCKHTPIAIAPKGERIYMLDGPKSRILVFEPRAAEGAGDAQETHDG